MLIYIRSLFSYYLLLLVIFFFFFHCSGTHALLHSFPTRRSSDLTLLTRSMPDRSPFTSTATHAPVTAACVAVLRSEEHTSELQSLRHLVCRLLLEKKKQKNLIYTQLLNIQKDAISLYEHELLRRH